MQAGKKLRRDRAIAEATVDERNGVSLIRLGPANIWDAGDLGRIRAAANKIFTNGGERLGIDLSHVGILPTGFLHMLCVWQEGGAEVYLFSPRPNVRNMFWFRRFTEPAGADIWRFTSTSSSTRIPPLEDDVAAPDYLAGTTSRGSPFD